jgi:DNA-binding response OmpR family regulator
MTTPRIPILVVEDEQAIRSGLCDVLAFNGYEPEGVERGDEGLERALSGNFALAILDVMLPGLNGFEICEKLRAAHPQQPILMLTARGSEEDILQGFRCGSDDYLTKPFSVAELMARVEALLRRTGAFGASEESASAFSFGAWEVDGAQLRAQREDDTIELTRRDLEILDLFHRERGHIVSRRRLLHDLWGFAEPDRVETRSVDMHIAKLRKKLGPETGALIETVRGEGYRYSG